MPRPLFAKAASTKATQEAGPPAPSAGDMATVAFLRGRVRSLADEVGHLEGQVVQAQEEFMASSNRALWYVFAMFGEAIDKEGALVLSNSSLWTHPIL